MIVYSLQFGGTIPELLTKSGYILTTYLGKLFLYLRVELFHFLEHSIQTAFVLKIREHKPCKNIICQSQIIFSLSGFCVRIKQV